MIEAGIPEEAIGLYPGATDVGAAILADCGRSMIFGSAKTVEQYRGNPAVQVHGPGFSKILLGMTVLMTGGTILMLWLIVSLLTVVGDA